MLSTGLLDWFFSDQSPMAAPAQNWLLGTCLIASIIFVETGLVVMPFLPGDSLSLAAWAFLGLTGTLPLTYGDHCRGWVKPMHITQTREALNRYGGMTITIGRFIPIVRTVAPVPRWALGMPARQFALYNVVGGVLWCSLLMMASGWARSCGCASICIGCRS